MTTLTDFLLARLAEDEACWPDPGHASYCEQRSCTCGVDRERVLADVEAKRAIVELHDRWDNATGGQYSPDYWQAPVEEILCALAQPYRDHPDFDESWRP